MSNIIDTFNANRKARQTQKDIDERIAEQERLRKNKEAMNKITKHFENQRAMLLQYSKCIDDEISLNNENITNSTSDLEELRYRRFNKELLWAKTTLSGLIFESTQFLSRIKLANIMKMALASINSVNSKLIESAIPLSSINLTNGAGMVTQLSVLETTMKESFNIVNTAFEFGQPIDTITSGDLSGSGNLSPAERAELDELRAQGVNVEISANVPDYINRINDLGDI